MSTAATRPAARKPAAPGRKPGVRELAAQETQDNILRAATRVFAKHGFSGGRIDQISKAAKSHDRMIYYYFGSKEGLFIEVLEETYRRMNDAESKLDLDTTQPVEALQAVIRFVVGYYRKNPEFITLLTTENLHKGKHISKSMRAREYSSPAIEVIRRVLESGQTQGLFRKDVSARDVYLLIAATGYFYMSNRHTLSAFLGEDLETPDALAHWESFVIDSVLRTVAPGPSLPKGRVAAA